MAEAATRSESRRLLAGETADSEDSDAAVDEAYSAPPPRSRLPQRAAVLAAFAAIGAVVAIGTAEQGGFALGGPEFLGLATVMPGQPLPFTAMQGCYGFTGETCNVRGCDVGRGAVCESSKCVCPSSCAGADGVCYAGTQNTLVKPSFSLANVKWPSYSMYVQHTSAFGQLKATNSYSWLNQETDKFVLYKLPGSPSKPSEERFFLASSAYPQHVARVAPTRSNSFSSQGLFATDLTGAYSPAALSLSACYNASAQALMLGNDAESSWVYLTRGSWLIYGYNGKREDLDEAGLWRPSPPLTDLEASGLPAC